MNQSNSIVEGFFSSAERFPKKTAIIWKGETLSYEEVSVNTRKVAAFLKKNGISKGDRVCFYGEKSPLFVYAYLATHLLGAVAIPLDVKLPKTAVQDVFSITEPKIILHPTQNELSLLQFPFDDQLLGTEPLVEYEFPDRSDLADILFTTGTTGSGKGVQLIHQNILAGATNSNEFIGNDHSDTEIIPLPLHHAFGLRRVRTNLYLGATIILVDGFMFPKLFFEAIEHWGATGICLVPAGFLVIKKLIKDRYIPYFRQLKYIEFGSSSMNIEDKREIAASLPTTRICMHYGLTEVAANIFTEFHDFNEKLESLGKPSPNVSVSILDELGNPCKNYEVGEVSVKGEIQTIGYWKNDKLSGDSFINGWFKTGDLGYLDEEGFVFLSGRKDDVINVGGKKVFPTEIEYALNQHPAIKDSACISVSDGKEVTGEKIKAFIQFEDGSKIEDKELVLFLSDKLEPYKIPRIFKSAESIPYTKSGKKQREQLKSNPKENA
ncbi:MAG: long-chain fatty acid--CoA ligase [Balneola sp.]|nr:MAG: long-chain fatty acid--CoA ligase [Balneola sp.]